MELPAVPGSDPFLVPLLPVDSGGRGTGDGCLGGRGGPQAIIAGNSSNNTIAGIITKGVRNRLDIQQSPVEPSNLFLDYLTRK